MPTNAISGARARLSISNVAIGYATNVTVNENYNYEPVNVLNLLEVREYVPVAYICNMTTGMVRIPGSPMKKFGSQNLEVFSLYSNVLTNGILDAQIEDKITNYILAKLSGLKAENKSTTFPARGLVTEDVTFVAIRMKDESEINP